MKNIFAVVAGCFLFGCGSGMPSIPVSTPTEPTSLTGGELFTVTAFQKWAGEQYIIVDVRKTDEPGKHLVPGALPVFLERLGPMYPGLADHDKTVAVLVIADKDEEALRAAQMLTVAGFEAAGLQGGIQSWIEAGFPTKIKLPE